MATLIIIRLRRPSARLRAYRILIDGQVVTSIESGRRVELPLPPGRHRVAARVAHIRSRPLEIEVGPGDVRHLFVGSNLDRRRPLKLAFYSAMWAPFAIVMLTLAGEVLVGGPFGRGWLRPFITSMMMLPSLLMLASLIMLRDQILYLEEIPPPGPGDRWVDPPPRQPLRVHMTVRGAMIAVAVLGVLIWAEIEWTRFWSGADFRVQANLHSELEANYRRLAEDNHLIATGLSATSPTATSIRKTASRAAAVADFHAAMKRKYEEAAARRRIAVEPDPSAPPWP